MNKLMNITRILCMFVVNVLVSAQAAQWDLKPTGFFGAETKFCSENTVLAQFYSPRSPNGSGRLLIDATDTGDRRKLHFPFGESFYVSHCTKDRALVRFDKTLGEKNREYYVYEWSFRTNATPELIAKGNGLELRVFPGSATSESVIAVKGNSDSKSCHFERSIPKAQLLCLDHHNFHLFPFSRGVIAAYSNPHNNDGEPDYAEFIYDLGGKRIARVDQDVNFLVSMVNYWMSPDGLSIYAACKRRGDSGSTLALFRICRLGLTGQPYRWEEIAQIENDGKAGIGEISLDAASNIYFARPGLHGGGIWRIDAKSKLVTIVIKPSPKGEFMSGPVVSPDGTSLTFHKNGELIIAHRR